MQNCRTLCRVKIGPSHVQNLSPRRQIYDWLHLLVFRIKDRGRLARGEKAMSSGADAAKSEEKKEEAKPEAKAEGAQV